MISHLRLLSVVGLALDLAVNKWIEFNVFDNNELFCSLNVTNNDH